MTGDERTALFELLALIHRDGGHYVGRHGLLKALVDAGEVIKADRQKGEENAEEVERLTLSSGRKSR